MMHLKTLLAILPLIAASQAFTIPDGIPDGEYVVRRDANGVDEHIPYVRDVAQQDSPVERDNVLVKRDDCVWCGFGAPNMDRGNCDAAVQNVKDQTRGGPSTGSIPSGFQCIADQICTVTIQRGQSYYAIRGNVVAFICNVGSDPASTNGGIFGRVLARITDVCGQYVPGAAYNADDKLFHGYQNWSPGTRFCDNVTKGTYKGCVTG